MSTKRSWYLDVLFITLVLGGLFFILLGSRPLFVPDEGRYAEIAREMVSSGNYITPHLNGVRYFEKPVLFYWLESAAIHLGGLNLWSLRSLNAILGLLGCLITYLTGRRLYGRTTGLLSAFILGTSTLYFVMAHMISLDLPVTVFISAALYAFLLGSQTTSTTHARFYFYAASAAAALAVLTKGLIGLVFPLMVIVTWIGILGDWRILKRLHLPSCILIFLLIAAPWHILVNQHNPGFLYFYFIEQQFLRYATMNIGHYQPVWFFIPCLLLGFFPWVLFLPQTILSSLPRSWKQRHELQTELFLLLWVVLIFAFFSFSKSKLIPYILPIFPALALLTGRFLVKVLHETRSASIRYSYYLGLIVSVGLEFTIYSFTQHTALPNPSLAKVYLYTASTMLLLGMLISALYAKRHLAKSLVITIVSTGLFLLLFIAAAPAMDTRTILPLANILKPLLQPGDEVITFNQYYQDLPFYLERRVSILNWKNELSFGMTLDDTSDWLINNTRFEQRWGGKQRVYAIMAVSNYEQIKNNSASRHFYLLGKTLNNVLVSNKP